FMDQITMGMEGFTVHATWIHEKQQWDAGNTANASNTLDTYRVDAQLHLGHRYCLIVSPFLTRGTSDSLLFSPAEVSGSRTASPNSNGIIAEADVNVWDNLRIQVQYTAYGKFNGSSTNYDGFGRNAADNNTLYVVTWIVF